MKSKQIIGLAVMAFMSLGCQSFQNRQMSREWKNLNDTINDCSQKIQNIVTTMQMNGTTTQATQERMLHDIDSIQRQMKDAILRCAERNKDNELGKYIQDNYREE